MLNTPKEYFRNELFGMSLQFELSPLWIFILFPIAFGLAWILYQKRGPWTARNNSLLRILRIGLLLALVLVLLGPLFKYYQSIIQKPLFLIAIDDSKSVGLSERFPDGAKFQNWLNQNQNNLEKAGYEVGIELLSQRSWDSVQSSDFFDFPNSDLQDFLRTSEAAYPGKKVNGLLLVSDGIYNKGISPEFLQFAHPIHTLAIGDTSEVADLRISFVDHNRIAYLNNEFPILVEWNAYDFSSEDVILELRDESGALIDSKKSQIQQKSNFETHQFNVKAEKPGRKRYFVSLYSKKEEKNLRNNKQEVLIDILDSRQRVLIAGLAPHPDIGALKKSIESVEGTQVLTWFPGSDSLPRNKLDLIICHQLPDLRMLTQPAWDLVLERKIPVWFIWNNQTDLRKLMGEFKGFINGRPLNQSDDITGQFVEGFTRFKLPEELSDRFIGLPPMKAPFGDYSAGSRSEVILFQAVGPIQTSRPLLLINGVDNPKTALLMGDGLWHWRLFEGGQYGKPELTDQLIQDIVQFLSKKEDKRRFKFYLKQGVFQEGEALNFQSEVYDELYNPREGTIIEVEVKGKNGFSSGYQFQYSSSTSKYPIKGLDKGDYSYTASVNLGYERFSESGGFSIEAFELETSRTRADYRLLRNLSKNTGGKFFSDFNDPELNNLFLEEPSQILTRRQSLESIIEWEWLAIILLTIASVEWFFRKRLGGY